MVVRPRNQGVWRIAQGPSWHCGWPGRSQPWIAGSAAGDVQYCAIPESGVGVKQVSKAGSNLVETASAKPLNPVTSWSGSCGSADKAAREARPMAAEALYVLQHRTGRGCRVPESREASGISTCNERKMPQLLSVTRRRISVPRCGFVTDCERRRLNHFRICLLAFRALRSCSFRRTCVLHQLHRIDTSTADDR
jgi:hypothetical protein